MDEKTIKARLTLIQELLSDKTKAFNSMTETLKKIDGYAVGSKETADKIEDYIRNQKKELNKLVEQEKLQDEVAKILLGFFNNTGAVVRLISKESEKFLHLKQGETIFLKQEIEKLSVVKAKHEEALLQREKQKEEEKKEDQTRLENNDKQEKEQTRIRPDQDPKTRTGRTAMDLVERRKKAREALELKEDKSQKKRGRKPRQN